MKAKEETKNKIHYIGNYDGLVDLVLDENGETAFLNFDGDILYNIRIDKTYNPPPREKITWLLPNISNILKEYKKHEKNDTCDTYDAKPPPRPFHCNACEELYFNILEYFPQFSKTPSELHYHYLTWMAFHSHSIEKFNFSPILFLVAAKDRGKTPTLKALSAICRRGIFTETFREANLIRWANDYGASLFFDVKNFPHKVEMADCEDLIYGRAERGVISSRVLNPERGAFNDMTNFSTFGVTGATSNKMVDDITEARMIVIHMPYSANVFNIEPTPKLGLPLRERLIGWRMAHHNNPFIEIQKTKPGKMENYLRGFEQMIKTFFPAHEQDFYEFKMMLIKEKKEDSESTFEGKLLYAVIINKVFVEEGSAFLPISKIAEIINKDRTERFKLSNDVIGKALVGMGFTKKRHSAQRGILYDEKLIEQLIEYYGIDEEFIEDESRGGGNQAQVSQVSLGQLQDYENLQEND